MSLLPAVNSGAGDTVAEAGVFSLHPPSVETDSICWIRTTFIQRRNAHTASGTNSQTRDEVRSDLAMGVGAIRFFINLNSDV